MGLLFLLVVRNATTFNPERFGTVVSFLVWSIAICAVVFMFAMTSRAVGPVVRELFDMFDTPEVSPKKTKFEPDTGEGDLRKADEPKFDQRLAPIRGEPQQPNFANKETAFNRPVASTESSPDTRAATLEEQAKMAADAPASSEMTITPGSIADREEATDLAASAPDKRIVYYYRPVDGERVRDALRAAHLQWTESDNFKNLINNPTNAIACSPTSDPATFKRLVAALRSAGITIRSIDFFRKSTKRGFEILNTSFLDGPSVDYPPLTDEQLDVAKCSPMHN
ncbi:hypothetical protein SAMN04487976_101157 [Xaviernesmea oryzae]|nr:hypothetical protein SAMN04487976_101157 [Xaviernesmea oryzae]